MTTRTAPPAPNPTKRDAGQLGGLTTLARHGPAYMAELARQKAAAQDPAARRLGMARLRSLRGKSPAVRARLAAAWKTEGER